MKTAPTEVSTVRTEATPPKANRRGVVIGAGVAGAAAIAGNALLRGGVEVPSAASAGAAASKAEGYRLTPHVLRYYETTKA